MNRSDLPTLTEHLHAAWARLQFDNGPWTAEAREAIRSIEEAMNAFSAKSPQPRHLRLVTDEHDEHQEESR